MATEAESDVDDKRPLSRFENVASYVCLVLCGGLSISTLLEVLARYTSLIPTQWTGGEVPVLFLIWLIAAGIVCATVSLAHLKLDLFTFEDKPQLKARLNLFNDVVSFLLLAAFAYFTLHFAVDNLRTLTPSLQISQAWTIGSLFVAAVVSALWLLVKTIRDLRAVLTTTTITKE